MTRFTQWAEVDASQAIKRPPAGRHSTLFYKDATAAFAFRCTGNCMIPTFYAGELVYIHPQETFRDGQIVALEIDGGRMLKRVYRTPDGIKLAPDNKEYEPVVVPASDVRVIGIAVARGCQPG